MASDTDPLYSVKSLGLYMSLGHFEESANLDCDEES